MIGPVLALVLCTADSGAGVLPESQARAQKLTVAVALGVDLQWMPPVRIANVAAWGEFDLGYRVLDWLRLELIAGGAWSPHHPPDYPGQHGTLRALAGADFIVLALRRGELFLGAGAGIQHTNLFYDDVYPLPPGYSTGWYGGVILLARVGFDFALRENFSIGALFAYSFFATFDLQQSTEARLRLTLRL